MIPNILITNEEQVSQNYAFLDTTGLPESEVDTLRAFNISQKDIQSLVDVFRGLDAEFYVNANEELIELIPFIADFVELLSTILDRLPEGSGAARIIFQPDVVTLGETTANLAVIIELADSLDPNTIVVSTLRLNETVSANPSEFTVGDQGGNGVPDLRVTFENIDLEDIVAPQEGEQVLLVTGELQEGEQLGGAGVLRVLADDFDPGDLDGDEDVDRDDLGIILAARNMPASGPDDSRDLDGDGVITALDARQLTLLCTRSRCATE